MCRQRCLLYRARIGQRDLGLEHEGHEHDLRTCVVVLVNVLLITQITILVAGLRDLALQKRYILISSPHLVQPA